MEVASAGAAGATVLNAYGYNRDAWMTNLLLGQVRNYQKQQILLSQAAMFREDIRQLISSSVARQNNFVLVLTLVMSMIENFYICVALPSGTPSFLWVVFQLCTGSSLIYLMLAVAFTIWGNHLAVGCQAELLTALVRLPITDLSVELLEQAPGESTEAFERQSARRMLRLPLMRRVAARRRTASSGPTLDGAGTVGQADRRNSGRRPRANSAGPPTHIPKGEITNAISSMQDNRDEHVKELLKRKAEWHALGGHTVVFGYLGLSTLLHAFSYFTAAKVYQKGTNAKWCSPIMQGLLTAMICALSFLFGGYRRVKAPKSIRVVSALLELGGQVSMFLAIRIQCPHLVHRLCSLSCFVCHFTLNIVVIYYTYVRGKLLRSSHEYAKPAKDASADGMTEMSSVASLKSTQSQREATSEVRFKHEHRHVVALLGSAIVMTAWLLCTGWSLYNTVDDLWTGKFRTTCPGDPASRRRLYGEPGAALSSPGKCDMACLNTSIRLLVQKLAHAKQRRQRLELKVAGLEGTLGKEQDPHRFPPFMTMMDDLIDRIDAEVYQE